MNHPLEQTLDINQCAKEPIHIPEAIQPHGALLVINQQNTIVRCSLNLEKILGLSPEAAIGKNIGDYFEPEFVALFEHALIKLSTNVEYSHTVRATLLGQDFVACIYLSNHLVALELIPELRNQYQFERKLAFLRRSLNELKELNSLNQKLDKIGTLLRHVSGFDRVMIYRFDKDFHGEVIAEDKIEHLDPYLGLHYPASDIPPQARELYLKNTVRIIPDVSYEPCGLSGAKVAALDMTHGSLRSVSPFHVQYLKNMGVQATLVCSLVLGDRLWGLIACHHSTPRVISYQLNELFRWMSMIISKEVRLTEYHEQEELTGHLKKINRTLLANLRSGDNTLASLFTPECGQDLLSIVNADGAACIFKDTVVSYGMAPEPHETKRIMTKLKQSKKTNDSMIVCTDLLPKMLDEPPSDHPFSTGLIALPISKNQNHVLMFFRKELVKTVTWGGNPDKAILSDGQQLRPRQSFEAWKQIVTGTSKEWRPAEIESAEQFVAAIDIEIRNQSEAELQLLRSSIANLNDVIIITEAEPFNQPGPKILFVNEAFERHTGYKASEVIGKTPRLLQGPGTSRETLNQLGKDLRAWKKSKIELLNYRKDGSEFWAEIDICPVANASGWYTHWISVQRDISERKLVEDTLRFISQKGWMSNSHDFLNSLCAHIATNLNVDYVIIGKLSANNDSIDSVSIYGLGQCIDNFSYHLKGMPCEDVVNKSIASYPNQVQQRFPNSKLLADLSIEAYFGMPLWTTEGAPLGVIAILHRKPIHNTSLAESLLKLISSRVESEILRQQSQEFIWHQANFDTLTDLPNRRMFQDRLDQEFKKAQRSTFQLALMFLDLDNFKEVNDSLGHDIGDLLLKEVASRIKECTREADTLARLGGDEFTIIMSEITDLQCIERVATEIINAIAQPFQLGHELVFISISMGITVYPDDSTDLDALMKNADQAMYAAKQAGRNRYSFFTDSMQKAAHKRMSITKELRRALDENQFSLVYQPIIDMRTGKIDKAEALIRWHHPHLGTVMPQEFITIAEDTGLINAIGDWVFKEAAEKVLLLRQVYNPAFQISVNKSPVQFRNENSYYTKWFEKIQALGLHGNAIVIEITESSLLDGSAYVQKKFDDFHSNGFKIAIDDFGTGYSSMSYLKKFDIDYLKIDRAFVNNLKFGSDDMMLCEAMIVMAHKLGIDVIAEGVETDEQRQLLLDAGADFGQGYLFSVPLPFDEFENMLKKNS